MTRPELLPCEAGSLVYDIGSSNIRFGFAGDAVPLYNIPSSVCVRESLQDIQFGQSWLEKKLPGIEISQMIDDTGAIANPDLLHTFFDWTYSEDLFNVEPEQGIPILVNQPAHLALQSEKLDKWRSTICEILFEFGHSHVCLEYDAALACFAHASHTATVCDFGWSYVRVVPVHEGRPLLKSMMITNAGGRELCAILESCLVRDNHPVKTYFDDPQCAVIPSESQKKFCQRTILQDMIKSCLSFETAPKEKYNYYFPGGELVDTYEWMKWLVGWLVGHNPNITAKRKTAPTDINICNAINNEHTPADIRKHLWGNIVMSGGLSRIPGLGSWLETNTKAPGKYTTRITPCPSREIGGMNTVWTGGSILASLDNFTDYCITRENWQENNMRVFDE